VVVYCFTLYLVKINRF